MKYSSNAQCLILIIGLFPLFITSCNTEPKAQTEWRKVFQRLGTGSSPKCIDLNQDGILDVIIGAGENENEVSDSSVLALDGKSGRVLWAVHAENQIVGSAIFMDITNDQIPDVFIGGRLAQFMAINGKTGEVIWRFKTSKSDSLMSCCFKFNFCNAQIISDTDKDGYRDLLVSNGGNPKAKPFDETLRVPGILAIISSRTGAVIKADTIPDGKETYMTPVVHDFNSDNNPLVVIGTGGETLGGNLFVVPLNDLINGSIANAKIIATEKNYGFIAPPTLADVNADDVKDIIVNWFGGKLMAFDGKTHKKLWERTVAKTESYSTAAPGYFNDDDIPDFFSIYNKGAWPKNIGSVQVLFDGKTGQILQQDSLGCMGYSSGVTADTDDDGFDEVFFSTNEFMCNAPAYAGDVIMEDRHSLMLLNHHLRKSFTLTTLRSKNISSTPWIGDMDGDGFMDIISCTQNNEFHVDQYGGISIERLKTNIRIKTTPTWNSYLGDGTCILNKRKNI